MRKSDLLSGIFPFFLLIFCYGEASGDQHEISEGWKAGVARVNITPQEPMWMRGYASRNRPSEGTLHDLWAKALAMEDINGKKAVLVTLDLCIMQKSFSDTIRNELYKKYSLDRSQIILSFSHTHSGPTIRGEGKNIYKDLISHELQKIERYSARLEDQLVKLVGEALGSMVPVEISSGNGTARFGVNRRNNKEAMINQLTELQGPVDHAVPVIKVSTASGDLLALVFGYACHATVLNTYQWSSDYPGLAQIALEKNFPGTTAMFFAGSGADINPLPRRTVSLAHQYGSSLAAAVVRVLHEPMRELDPNLVTKYSEIGLSYTALPTSSDPSILQTGTYPYPVQIWRIGGQNMVILGGELVVDYGIRLKNIFGQDLFVMAYANAVMGYIPSTRVLREGGYEGIKALNSIDGPSTWKANIESLIVQEVLNLAEQAKISPPESRPGN